MSVNFDQQLAHATLDASTQQSDQQLVAAVSGKKIRVGTIYVSTDTAITVTFESSTTTAKLKLYAGATGGVVLDGAGQWLFETAAGESLTVTTSAVANVWVDVGYSVEP